MASTLSDLRANYFDKLRASQITKPIYPNYPQGPQFISATDQVPKSRTCLLKKCKESYFSNSTDLKISMGISEVVGSLVESRDNEGLAVHLLHLYPFEMIKKIYADEKFDCKIEDQAVDIILREVLERHEDLIQWIGVPNDNTLKNTLMEEARMYKTNALLDPLKSNEGQWGSLLLQKIDVKYLRSGMILGVYVMNRTRLQTKVAVMKDHFTKYKPHYIMGKHCPVEITLIKRLKKACEVFNYGYSIEKLRPAKKEKLGFIKVPEKIAEWIDNAVQIKQGSASLNYVIKELMSNLASSETNKFELFQSIIHLLRHISERKDGSQDIKDIRWIFAVNKNTDNESDTESESDLSSDEEDMARGIATIAGCKLELTSDNLGKYLFNSLSSLEMKYNVDFTNYKENADLLKSVIIGFPHACGLRSKSDPTQMCRMRFSDIPSKFSHVRGYHRMSQNIQGTLESLGNNSPCQLQSEEEWLDKNGILHVYDTEKLMKIENLGHLYEEFYRLHYSLKEAIASICLLRKRTIDYYDKQIEIEKAKICLEPDKHRVKNIKQDIHKLKMDKKAFALEGETLYAWLLPETVVEDHMIALEKAVQNQREVNELFYRHQFELQKNAQSKIDMIGQKLVDGWKDSVHKTGGKNFASIAPEQCMQYMGDGKKSGSNMFATMVLGLAGQHVRHRAQSNDIHHRPYEEWISPQKDKRCDDDNQSLDAGNCDERKERCLNKSFPSTQYPDEEEKAVVETCAMSKEIPLGSDDRTLPPSSSLSTWTSSSLIPIEKGRHSSQRKRRCDTSLEPEPSELVKLAKLSEQYMSDDKVLRVDEYQLMKKWSSSPTIKIDARHFSPTDMKQFVGGTKLLPGSQIVRVGKGSDFDTTTYEPIDPRTIYVDVRDYKDLLFYLILLMRRDDLPAYKFKMMVVNAFVNVLNVMFALTENGSYRMQKCLDTVIRSKTSSLNKKDKDFMWLVLLNAIVALNKNQDGKFTDFFCVRLSRHGDASMVPAKIAPESSYSYARERAIDDGKLYDMLSSDKIIFHFPVKENIRVDHQDFFKRQTLLIKKLQDQYKNEIACLHDRKQSGELVITETVRSFEKSSSRPSTKYILPKQQGQIALGAAPQWEFTIPQSTFLKHHKKELTRHRSFDMTPTPKLPNEDLERYDAEINHVRSEICAICLDTFDSRPLEGLNCVYKELELEFRKRYGVRDGDRLELNADMWKQFQLFVSENIDKKARKNMHNEIIEANGMHLFHRSCLRQYIQRKVLEMKDEPIPCPICNVNIYTVEEKAIILRNIDELSSRLGEYAMSDNIALHNTDEMINLKNSVGTNPLIRYLQGNGLGDKDIKEDQSFQDEMKGVVKPVEIDYFKKQPEMLQHIQKAYKEFVIEREDKDFTPLHLAKAAIDTNLFATNTVQCC